MSSLRFWSHHTTFSFFVIFYVFSTHVSFALPIDTIFKLPSPIPTWPLGGGFGSGSIDVGGLRLNQVTSFNKIWSCLERGQDDQGITFFESSPIPDGFFMLGGYSQPNRRPLSGWVLVGHDVDGSSLRPPTNYTLFWTSNDLNLNQDAIAYFWLPVAPDGYKPVGYVVTNTPDMPSFDRIRCVRADLTDEAELGPWMFSAKTLNIFEMRPKNRTVDSLSVSVGTYVAQYDWEGLTSKLPLSCLKQHVSRFTSSLMPNMDQIEAVVEAYAPLVYFHPEDEYLPSSLTWFFTNGGLLYNDLDPTHPEPINQDGSNLPQQDTYWVDLPADDAEKERVKRGNLESAEAYVHAKPVFGGTFTDVAMWLFYPYNGPIRIKILFITITPPWHVGTHVGDWEHVTLRISNFNGELVAVYFGQHSGGEWVSASELEYYNYSKFVAYSSRHGHAMYPREGLVLQGKDGVGVRNDAAKSDMVVETSVKYLIIAAEYLESNKEAEWVNFNGKWGPKIVYDLKGELENVKKYLLIEKLKQLYQSLLDKLPRELFGEEGPTGPKSKASWLGDEE